MTTVSVIMPTYQAAGHVRRSVRSILTQTFTDLELIVGDDGSTDDTRSILDSFDDARILRSHSEENIGSLRTRNRLLGLARGEFIAFQDADDESVPHRLEALAAVFRANPAVGAVGSNCDYVDTAGRYLSRSDKPLTHEAIVAAARGGNPFVFPTLMVRRSVIERVGVFREYFWDLGNYDLDWTLRLMEQTRCANLPDSLLRFQLQWGSNSLTVRNPRKLLSDRLALFLAEERRSRGTDSLEEGLLGRLDEFFLPLEEELRRDPARHLRELAGEFARRGAVEISVRAAVAAIRSEPLRSRNYRALAYVARHFVLSRTDTRTPRRAIS
jgi:glycosyltransferase involved in cell wall biosynthesis